MVVDYFHVQLSDDKQVRHFLELSYAGAILRDSWVLTDVGITPSSAICCLLKAHDPGAQQCGLTLPFSSFRLTLSLPACNCVPAPGGTLHRCFSGPPGPGRLAAGEGVRVIEPVGVHPYREWCHQTAHPDVAKCPAVASIERGQLTILKLFIASSVLTLACRDPQGRDPLRIALQYGHRECVRHLATKLCSVVVLPGMALPMRTYLQIKGWVRLGQRRAASRHCMSLNRAPFRTRVGDTVLVDGFTLPKMSSKPRRSEAKAGIRVMSTASRCLIPINCPSHVSCPLRALASQDKPLQLPKLHPVATRDEREKKRGCGRKGCEEDESGDQNSNQWRSRVPLPPISRDTNLRPVFASPNSAQILTTSLEAFSLHCDRTPRENAIYCLALASAFTQRPWLQQLNVARTLSRRSAQHIG
ncbi:protein ANKUB1-like [Oncorhynchus masou masou]|uniref:protein ANKUB1-like n=1 Tax=Oncorhynchus masou masou TaxID=90313 RepID=UPI003183A2A2